MKKAIITFGTGPHAEYLAIARPSFTAYAARHGYDYYEAQNIGTNRPAPWYKVQALQGLLKAGYDAAIFIGADLVIVDGHADVMDDISTDVWQAMVQHNTADGVVPNTDMWIVTQAMLPYLAQVWEQKDLIYHGWWEQAALLRVMGYQLAPCKPIEETELAKRTQFIDACWNVHLWDRPQPEHPRFQHATMWPDRAEIMRTWAKQAEEWINE